jgi:hypothetical protein
LTPPDRPIGAASPTRRLPDGRPGDGPVGEGGDGWAVRHEAGGGITAGGKIVDIASFLGPYLEGVRAK